MNFVLIRVILHNISVYGIQRESEREDSAHRSIAMIRQCWSLIN